LHPRVAGDYAEAACSTTIVANCASYAPIAICGYPVRPFPPFKVRGAPAYGDCAGVFASDATLPRGRFRSSMCYGRAIVDRLKSLRGPGES
jgi:hypothetical protein